MAELKNNNILIMCNNKTWTLEIIDEQNLLTKGIINQLKDLDEQIYFNDTNSKYWMFDFKIDDIWFESIEIDCVNKKILLNTYK